MSVSAIPLPWLLALLLVFTNAAHAQQTEAFAKANEEYASGRFRESIELYDGIVRSRHFSAALFYNLANASYRAGDLGRAILNYERALALEPHHPEAEANLRLVRDKARALELRKSRVERAAIRVTSTQYAIIAAVAFWIAAFALTAWLFRRRRSPALALLSLAALLIAGAAGFALYSLETGATGRALAIVVGNKTDARLATADNAGTVLSLPPGSEVKILSTRGEWIYAALPNDLRGWIPAQSVERVRL